MKPFHLILTAALLLTLCGCAPKYDAPMVTPTPTTPVTAAPVERPLHSAEPTVTPTTSPDTEPTPTYKPGNNQTPFG